MIGNRYELQKNENELYEKEKEEVFVNLFSQCRDYGFTE